MQRKKRCAEINYYNIQFFHNLYYIPCNFRMKHDRELKMCRDHLCNIQFLHNLQSPDGVTINFRTRNMTDKENMCQYHVTFNSFATYPLYKWGMTCRERKDASVKIIDTTINSFTTYHLYKFQNEAWQRKKKCAKVIQLNIQFFTTYPL